MLLDSFKKHVGSLINSQENGWRPSYLRKRVLVLFVVAFSAIIAAVEVLYHSSESHDGIAASTQSRHYLWTYGPTAILTIIATFWSRVEFQSKQNAPWQSMLDAPQPAEKSVLLDYISDMQPVAMWKAFKNKHLIVFSGVSCSLLLQLMIVFSTGLFSLEEVKVRKQNVPIQLHTLFSTQNSTLDTVGSQPYDIVNGLAFDNLTYPLGTNVDITFQEFSAPTLPSDVIITAPINGLVANLSCEKASLDIKGLEWSEVIDQDDGSVRSATIVQNFRLATPSCTIDNFSQVTLGNVEIAQAAIFQWARCENITGSDGTRVVVSLVEVYKSTTATKNTTSNSRRYHPVHEDTLLELNKSITLICKPTLSQVKLEAEGNATELSSNIQLRTLGVEDANFPDLTAGDLAAFIHDNVSDTSGFRSIEYFHPFGTDIYVDDQLKLGMLLMRATITIESLWQDGVLQNAAAAYYRSITAQLLHLGLAHRHESTTDGSALMNEKRVLMMQLPLRVIEASLVVAILWTIFMIWLIPPETIATWNSAHISAIAAITANSEDFRLSLHGAGVASSSVLQSHLVGKKYYSQSTPKGTYIQVEEETRELSGFDGKIGEKYCTWKPFPSLLYRVAIFVLVCAAIAMLEVLLHLSQEKQGLGNASPANEYTHYLWTVIPAGMMTGFSLLFGSIDFNTRCLAPYAHLKRPTGATFEQSMSLSFLDSHGINNSLRSLRPGHFAVLATTLATGAAWFLTIVISGLYSAIEVPSHTFVNFTRIGGFPDPRTIAGAKLNTEETAEVAGILTSEYILQYNFSFPRWSYDELAFAKLSMDDVSNNTAVNGTYVDIRVPALRAAPVCNLLTATDLKPNLTRYVYGKTVSYQLRVETTMLPCPGNNKGYSGPSNVFTVTSLEDGPFGYSIESNCHSDSGLTGSSHYTETYIWGHVNSTSVKSIMGLNCIQYAETVDVMTRFKLPDMDIDEDNPPVPDESSAKLAPDLYTPIPEWWALNTNGQYPTLDGFFYLLVSGRYAIPVDDLKDLAKNQTVINAIKHQHKLINAQQFNNYTRSTSNDSVEHMPILGNITNTSRVRLMQDATSTRILEGLLGAMLVFGIIGSVLLNTDHILPKNPCSIASVASFVADSSLLDQFTQGVWDPDDKLLRETFAGRRFYLGWWEQGPSDGREDERLFAIDHIASGEKL
ncbi:hypothetical protein PEBR_25594 [Penicillium brasilianum]|uniref:Uncharacterized protein n=1 Tax=Penicillium brasilianum TaxID=104259 RepID=A0A1S9RKS9_PENBI|nr:hypothetical protein PEBR_25594 [Penicillium brasilianum]